jgi:para-nitrobenzyl esterase
LRGERTASGLAFLGIRYGAPPLGALRWKPPIPWRPTDGVYDATRFGPSPPQLPCPATSWRPAFSPKLMSEDCLNLNVFTPAADGARRPVLVHAFGGGFETGSASEGWDGARLAAQGDAVVVRPNFRVGALGFLHLGGAFGADYEWANRGALDLVLALQWVHENIAALGGDPDNVTLFGLSSGAFMIAALFAMPISHGLFAKAWMQSGSASRVLTREQAAKVTSQFLAAAGVASGDERALQNLNVTTILAAQRKAAANDIGNRNAPGGRTLGIVGDGTSLAEHPLTAFERGERSHAPIVLGFTRDEARLWFAGGAMRLPSSFEDVRAEVVGFAGDDERGRRLYGFYRTRYRDSDPVRLRERFLTDAVYAAPALRTARAHANAGGRAFLYRFDWSPPGALSSLGAAHGFDEAFVWNAIDGAAFPPAKDDARASALAQEMSSALIALARNGSPGWADLASAEQMRIFGGAQDSAPIDDDLAAAWLDAPRR